jgi:hypothetical protein
MEGLGLDLQTVVSVVEKTRAEYAKETARRLAQAKAALVSRREAEAACQEQVAVHAAQVRTYNMWLLWSARAKKGLRIVVYGSLESSLSSSSMEREVNNKLLFCPRMHVSRLMWLFLRSICTFYCSRVSRSVGGGSDGAGGG